MKLKRMRADVYKRFKRWQPPAGLHATIRKTLQG
jgi:ribosomal protein L32E